MSIRETLTRLYQQPANVHQELRVPLQTLFREALNRISEKWADGTYDQLRVINPELDRAIQSAEDNLNTVWKLCLAGQQTLESFQKAMVIWEDLHYEAIREMEEAK
jgi:hypothetical protein